ncbi:MAG: ABC transporter ATP-binding protein [Candidatus Heimdallarchaeota archaeon]|nr:MAG: ABC transporter ATP-binding protein [Candidatus Heimdallarchaeota archaeon]
MQIQKIVSETKQKGKVIIRTDKLCKYYGKDIKAVDELDLEVFEGETFGLLGPNGAGKTTTVRLLNCILKPTSGTADVNGYNITENSTKVKTITGLLAESPGLYEKLSAYEFLEFMGALYNIKGTILKERIEELLSLFGLTDRKDYLLEGFSSGMKQKVLIAAALINDPSIIFFDEPTAALDPRAAHMVKDLIKGLADQLGRTVVICSHILPIVEELCDRIGIINQGRLIAVGTVDEIIAQAGTDTLEEAFIALTGGVDEKELLAWRDHS